VRLQNAPPPPAETISTVTQQKPTEPVQIAKPQPVAPPAPAALPSMSAKFDRANCKIPDYPPESQARDETGTTQLEVLVDVDGRPLEIKIAKTSGFRRLDDAAKKAFMKCRFTPAVVNGQPSQSLQGIIYEWTLE